MMNSESYLIKKEKNVFFQQIKPSKLVFDVRENGFLNASFLQLNRGLDVEVILSGEGATCDINCAYLINNNNNLNININVLHQSKNTASNQRIKGLVTDTANVNFIGTIQIPKNSQKCDGKQNHRAILLSPRAVVSATPELEIWANDVICSHGSAVGPLDKRQLFYLQSRGLDQQIAKQILLKSFLGDLMPEEFSGIIQEWMKENV